MAHCVTFMLCAINIAVDVLYPDHILLDVSPGCTHVHG